MSFNWPGKGMIPGGPSCFEEKIKPEYQSLETLTKDLGMSKSLYDWYN